jgi:hypothetical protein
MIVVAWNGNYPQGVRGMVASIIMEEFTFTDMGNLQRGPIPERMQVLHICDNPPCVIINHLFLGTISDNSSGMMAKGRGNGQFGEFHSNTKLTRDQVEAVYLGTRLQYEIAASYNISKSTISLIKNGRKWKSLFREIHPLPHVPDLFA